MLMWILRLLLFLAINKLSESADSVRCYSCSNVLQDNQCTRTVTSCGHDQICYKSVQLVNDRRTYSLGCLHNQTCASRTVKPAIVGRGIDSRRAADTCLECCSDDGCNVHLCDHRIPEACHDDSTVDCPRMHSLFSICDDIPHAETVCPKYCNVCCVVDGNWGLWSDWSGCSVTCETGKQSRFRTCSDPMPAFGGSTCTGNNKEYQSCHVITPCPVHGNWGQWSNWGACSTTCGNGIQNRDRTCNDPTPINAGMYCPGHNTDAKICNVRPCAVYTDCSEIKKHLPDSTDGIYPVILWRTRRTIEVYCDMTTKGGGWTVFQHRYNGAVDFYRNFHQYESGFGNLNTEFWLGLDYLHEMTTQTQNTLRIDLMASDGRTGYEEFGQFSVSPGSSYTLHVGYTTAAYNIGSGYSFRSGHKGQPFSTYDHDVDGYSGNCAAKYHGGWWYSNCYNANLNGQYLTPGSSGNTGIIYDSFRFSSSLKETTMSFRRSNM
ncbi:Thrombospondin-2 [Mactra antiquata]